jgi:hypothetical protein
VIDRRSITPRPASLGPQDAPLEGLQRHATGHRAEDPVTEAKDPVVEEAFANEFHQVLELVPREPDARREQRVDAGVGIPC